MNAMNIEANMPPDVLAEKAAKQRYRIHETVNELRGQIEERLDVRKRVAPYVAPASGIAALAGIVLGWGLAGFLAPRRR